ncbi:MAG: hypothetical protein WAM42_21450 [Candidatus Nitrosopolaris sp.]
MKVLKSEDDVSDVSNVSFSEDTTKPPADCSNEITIGRPEERTEQTAATDLYVEYDHGN